MRSWTPGVPIAAGFAMSLAVYNRLPAFVRPHLEAIFPAGLVPATVESLPRAGAALLLPCAAMLVWALLAGLARLRAPVSVLPSWLASEDTDARAVARFESTYHTLVFSIVSCVVVFHFAILGSAVGWPLWSFQAAQVAVGIALLAAGNVLPRSRPNWIVGIRTKGTLGSASVWMRTHRLFGAYLMVVGCLVIVAAAVAPTLAVLTAKVGVLLAGVAALAMGARGDAAAIARQVIIAIATALPMGAMAAQAPASVPAVRVDTTTPSGVTESEVSIRTKDIKAARVAEAEVVRG